MISEAVVQPIGRVFVKIKCTNPKCRKQFSVEVKDSEFLTNCPRCFRRYYVHIEGTNVWIKGINNQAEKIPSKTPKDVQVPKTKC